MHRYERRQVEERVLTEALEWIEKARWHIKNPDASKAIPDNWDNSALHTDNMLHVVSRRLERGWGYYPEGEEPDGQGDEE